MSWWAVAAVCVGCYLEKLVGLAIPPRLLAARPRLAGRLEILPAALLAALVATSVAGSGHRLVLDARLAGLGVAALLLRRRAPLLLVVVAGAAVTGLVRLL